MHEAAIPDHDACIIMHLPLLLVRARTAATDADAAAAACMRACVHAWLPA
jgi:hypothetical protein